MNLKNSEILKVLFCTDGTISRRQYWAGLLLLLMLLNASFLWFTWADLEVIKSARTVYSHQEISFQVAMSIKNILVLSSPQLIPFSFIILYSSFVLAIKRSRSFGMRKTGWLMGVFTYLMFMAVNVFFVVYFECLQSHMTAVFVHPVMIGVYCFVGLGLLVGIISIFILSRNNEVDYNEGIPSRKCNSINYIFRLTIILIIWKMAVAVLNLVEIDLTITRIARNITLIIILLLIFIQVLKRSKDAGINILIPILVTLVEMIILGCFFTAISLGVFEEQQILLTFSEHFCYYSGVIFQTLFFVLIVLPSKHSPHILSKSNDYE